MAQTAAKVRSGLAVTPAAAADAESADGATKAPLLFLTEATLRPEALAVA